MSLPEQDFTKPPQDYLRCLERFGLEYRVEYLTHIGLSRHLSDRARLFLTRILSFPWRKTKGDMIFIYGNRP